MLSGQSRALRFWPSRNVAQVTAVSENGLPCKVAAGLEEALYPHESHRRALCYLPQRAGGVLRFLRIAAMAEDVAEGLHIG